MRIRLEGLQLQLLGFIIVPFSLLLLGIAILGINIHNDAMRQLVAERDERAVRANAAAISERLHHREAAVMGLSLRLNDETSPQEVIGDVQFLYDDFDGGLVAIGVDGEIVASSVPFENWQMTPILELIDALENNQVAYSDPYWVSDVAFVLLGARADDHFAAGAFSIGNLVPQSFAGSDDVSDAFSTLVIDSSGDLLFGRGDLSNQENLLQHPGIQAALRGEMGSSYLPAMDGEHVVAFSRIDPTEWALIIEEPWQSVASPLLDLSLAAPMILVPALLVTSFALWFGARKIIRPLRMLEEEASRLAEADYSAIEVPVGGIAEIEKLQQTLILMTHRIRTAQEALQSYVGAITDAQEEERKRLARELHDETIQDLIVIGQRIQVVSMDMPVEGPSVVKLDDLRSEVLRTISEIRRIVHALRPLYLDDLGLIPALEMLVKDYRSDFDLPVELDISGEVKRLGPEIELAIYRIVQESLSNTGKHACATRASIKLVFDDPGFSIRISDDGSGFAVPERYIEFAAAGHFGLLGMVERAEVIGASLSIQSTPGEGTRLHISLPSPMQYTPDDPEIPTN